MVKISVETIKSRHALAGYAITCITIVETIAIYKGINGSLLAIAVAFIAGLGGYYGRRVQPEP